MKKSLFVVLLIAFATILNAQFESPQINGDEFSGMKVRVGGDFALQYQVINHHADSSLIPLGTGFNLPTANFNLDVDLAKGVKLNLQTYLSARHHNEAWVKGGYIMFDELPFIKSDLVDKIMDKVTIWVGDMELNYGDAHFRRSDNGNVINNPFVGNYIMDAFTTAPAMEIMYRNNGLLLMAATSTGNLRQDLTLYSNNAFTAYDAHKELGFYWKAGYDKNVSERIRVRFTVSGYHMPESNHRSTLYFGDRTGSRYYLVMNLAKSGATATDIKSNHLNTYFTPGTATRTNAFMLNLFSKIYDFEFFGTYENATGLYPTTKGFRFSQFASEVLYRFGKDENFYVGGRYNVVKGNTDSGNNASLTKTVDRFQFGAGWFLIKNMLLKLEYVKQNYKQFTDVYGADAGFNGVMFEAAVSF